VVADIGDDDGGAGAAIEYRPLLMVVESPLVMTSREGWTGGFVRWLSRTVGSRVCVRVSVWISVAQAVVDSPWFETRRWIGSVERAVEAERLDEVTLAMAVDAVDGLAERTVVRLMGQSASGELGQRDEMVKRRREPKSGDLGRREREGRRDGSLGRYGWVYQGQSVEERGSGNQLRVGVRAGVRGRRGSGRTKRAGTRATNQGNSC
jgi:hypothetical protein